MKIREQMQSWPVIEAMRYRYGVIKCRNRSLTRHCPLTALHSTLVFATQCSRIYSVGIIYAANKELLERSRLDGNRVQGDQTWLHSWCVSDLRS
jgi:hypothetical protein